MGEFTHKWFCYGKTPMQTFAESKHLAKDKELDNLDNQKWWAFDTTSRTDSTVGNNLTVRLNRDHYT
jgi:hypothetical protein